MALRQRSLHLIGLSKSQSPKRKAASDATSVSVAKGSLQADMESQAKG